MDKFLDMDNLLDSLRSGFIEKQSGHNYQLAPSLLINDYTHGKKILTSLTQEMSTCDAFDFSVAFINDQGLASILEKLDYLRKHNVKGRILTTNYLNFTTPGSLSKILEFPNIELRVYTKGGFHPKGYIFKHSNYYSMIIGSANLTASALSQNHEWSIRFLSLTDGQIVHSVREEFERVWLDSEAVTAEWLNDYTIDYNLKKIKLQSITKNNNNNILSDNYIDDSDVDDETLDIVPNSMQQEAMVALGELREKNESRGLLIAATGTGKTYLSIFDVKQSNPKRVLYVAHRDMILHKAESSYKNLLPHIKTGFLNGNQKDFHSDYLFASIYTLAKDETLTHFSREAFDYIIIDEVHHAGASSYQKVINYFNPKFLLGLTATPERTDGFDIFSLFDNNVAYEIRLQKALEEDLLCPFHYYGLTDFTVNNETIGDKSDFSKLIADERIRHIKESILLYKSNDFPVKGLIFCSRVEEAKILSEKLNEQGFYTTYLTGDHSDMEREETISRLESNDDPLQYIISVDIFNEGVDIPCINQVVMLRPTQSAIIFVQQLGRGLRKNKDKSYVSVIDFIGNYENNFFIPIALYGDNSCNKDNLRRALTQESGCIPGTSTIQINEIARQKIFDAITETKVFGNKKFLKAEYSKLKMRLGRVPTMMDFVKNGFIDPLLFVEKMGSFYEFKMEMKDHGSELNEEEKLSLRFISKEFAHGLRIHELLCLKLLLDKETFALHDFEEILNTYSVSFTMQDILGLCNTLSPNFYTQPDKDVYHMIQYVEFDEEDSTLKRSAAFSMLLKNIHYVRELYDCLEYGLERARLRKTEQYGSHNFIFYRKYSRKDVCKLLNWGKNITAQNIGGYFISEDNGEMTCPVFVTYKKSEDIAESIDYDDRFIDSSRLNWMSKSGRTLLSPDVSRIINQKKNGIQIFLFVKKDDNEGTDFYFLGPMSTTERFHEMTMKNTNKSVVNIEFAMETNVPQHLYDYLEK